MQGELVCLPEGSTQGEVDSAASWGPSASACWFVTTHSPVPCALSLLLHMCRSAVWGIGVGWDLQDPICWDPALSKRGSRRQVRASYPVH